MAKPKQIDTPKSPARRRFLRGIGAASVATIATAATGVDWLRPREAAGAQSEVAAGPSGHPGRAAVIRRERAFQHRMHAAMSEKHVAMPPHLTNGDEALYPNRIGNYSKGLPHNSLGEVDTTAYAALVKAATNGKPADFDAIPMGGTVLLIDPQAGLAFELEGTDSHQMEIPPAPALASAERAGEAVEGYWEALLRDVPFSQYGTSPLAGAAISDLNKLSDFRGPRAGGLVTPGTLFRG